MAKGDLVGYKYNAADIEAIRNYKRSFPDTKVAARAAGDVAVALVLNQTGTAINAKVFVDGEMELYRAAVASGAGNGQWAVL